MKNVAVLIPTLNPDTKLVALVKRLMDIGMYNIYIVNDGSNNISESIFCELEELGCDVSHHPVNRGKGDALKTGIQRISENQKNITVIVTADGDGQHAPQDIKNVAQEVLKNDTVVLGTRKFDNKNMPVTSKIGNSFSSLYFKLKTGKDLKDTQTGLRGIPSRYIPFALNVPGSRYDYEMRFLESMCKHDITYTTVDISTIYDADWTTHFRFLSDSYSIYKTFFRNVFSSLSSAVLDVTLFILLVNVISVGNAIILSTILARLLSGAYNFTLNKVWTFEKKDSQNTGTESKKYFALFSVQMFVSGIATSLLNALFGASKFVLLFIKMFVDLVLFMTNFMIQKNWVFSRKAY